MNSAGTSQLDIQIVVRRDRCFIGGQEVLQGGFKIRIPDDRVVDRRVTICADFDNDRCGRIVRKIKARNIYYSDFVVRSVVHHGCGDGPVGSGCAWE